MNWTEISGWTHGGLEDLYRRIVAESDTGDVIVEVGAWLGRSTALMGTLVRDQKPGLDFYSVDHGLGVPGQEEQRRLIEAEGTCIGILHRNLVRCGVNENVRLLVTDSLQAADLFLDPPRADVVVIDGSHSAPDVMSDLNAWWPCIRDDGWLYGHDWDWPGVRMSVEVFFGASKVERFGDTCWGVRHAPA